jgi:hypothetical protein
VLLRCPRCAVRESYGPTQVHGELVVCTRCHTPFAWQVGEADRSEIAGQQRTQVINPEGVEESPR